MKKDLTILQLEDDPLEAELIQRFLRNAGVSIDTHVAADRKEFEFEVVSGQFDVVLADNSLPQFNSLEALRVLREHRSDIPFILVTGTVSEEFAVEVIQKGADDYILKNNLARLPSAIGRAVEKRRIQREKLLTEAALRQSEEEYRHLFELTPLAAWVIDEQTFGFLTVNSAAARLYGYTPAEFKTLHLDNIQRSRDDGLVKHVTKDGRVIDAEIISTPVLYNNHSARLVLINDLTEQLKAEAEIRQMNLELRELSAHLQNVREEERIQIARDVHDELGQQITGLRMALHFLSKKSGLQDEFTDVMEAMEDLVTSVRRIASNLRPHLLDDFGLAEALRWQGQDVEKRFGISVCFESDPPNIDLPPGISTGLFRIYQEVLTNAVRHSGAHRIDSSLRIDDGRLVMDVRDDGTGMDLTAAPKRKSFGLLGIKERVFLLNGQYTLSSEPGKGTRWSVSIPLGSSQKQFL